MNIIINVVATGESGTLSVAISFVERITKFFPEHNFYLLTTLNLTSRLEEGANVKIVSLPSFYVKRFIRPFSDNFIFPCLLRRLNAELILNFDNLALKTDIRQVHIVGNSYMNKSCKDFSFLGLHEKSISCFRKFLFYQRVKFVDRFVFQTEAMANAFPDKIKEKGYVIIPNFHEDKIPEKVNFKKEDGFKYLLYVSYFYPHKNFEIFLPLAKIVKEEGLKIKFLVSFQGRRGKKLYEKIKQNNLDDIVINTGNLSAGNIQFLYQNVDAIFFPSFLESFSQILADAKHHELPVIIADTDYSRHLFKDKAFYFNPKNPNDAYRAIKTFDEERAKIYRSNRSYSDNEYDSSGVLEELWKSFLEVELKK